MPQSIIGIGEAGEKALAEYAGSIFRTSRGIFYESTRKVYCFCKKAFARVKDAGRILQDLLKMGIFQKVHRSCKEGECF